jgi:quercetin dioxygenase-like cupin family protein
MPLYEWNQLPQEQMSALVGRKVIHTALMTVARLELQKGASVPEHSHENEQIAMVERGAVKFFIEGKELIVRGGEVLTIAPHVPHGVEVLEDSVVVDLFAPPRADWIRGDDAYLRK